MPDSVAENYAAALFETAVDKNRIEAYMQQLQTVMETVSASSDLFKALMNPIISMDEKARAVRRIFSDTCDEEIIRFIGIIIKNRRLSRLGDIVKQYAHLYRRHAGILEVRAVAARPLNPDIMAMLKGQLEKTYGKSVYIENIVDPSIMGGLRLEIDGRTIDRSVASRLSAIKSAARRLAANISV
ncbi:MAG: F-type H+-transporting ATPase subunit delta [Clostridiales bacterium]|jgi:F-type H+-transporting ATPase subunit delta|nr:F-type H+-transporting ATPase subunit delta [Clostridiales bacterium]